MSCPQKPAPTSPILSTATSLGLLTDGACFVHAGTVAELLTDTLPVVTAGTQLASYTVPACGALGTYSYTAKVTPFTVISALQILGYPIPVVSMADNPTRCYWEPVLATEPVDAISAVLPSGVCGTAFRYSSCQGNTSLVVAYEEGDPAAGVRYGGRCYGAPSLLIGSTGTASLVSSGSVTVTSGCADVLCTGSSATGAAFPYTDSLTGQVVQVQFEHLDLGIPVCGVAPMQVEPDYLMPGSASVKFLDSPVVKLLTAACSGWLYFELSGRLQAVGKRIKQVRAGVTNEVVLRPSVGVLDLEVQAGDEIYLAVGRSDTHLGRTNRGLSGRVTWEPARPALRPYGSATLQQGGTVLALGFCGLSTRSPYAFHASLPAASAQIAPVVQGVVTVLSSGTEYGLLRSRTLGQPLSAFPDGSQVYAGQGLTSPLDFRFYGAGESQGAHGEMDVWLSSTGTFPAVLSAGPFRELVRVPDGYRHAASLLDTHRSSVSVLPSVSSNILGIYRSATGERVQAYEAPGVGAIAVGGELFSNKGQTVGIGCNVLFEGGLIGHSPFFGYPMLGRFKLFEPDPPPPGSVTVTRLSAKSEGCEGVITFSAPYGSVVDPQAVRWKFSGSVTLADESSAIPDPDYTPTEEFPVRYLDTGPFDVDSGGVVLRVKVTSAYHALPGSAYRSMDAIVEILDGPAEPTALFPNAPDWHVDRENDIVEFYAGDYKFPVYAVRYPNTAAVHEAPEYGLERVLRRASERQFAASEMESLDGILFSNYGPTMSSARFQDNLGSGPYPPDNFFSEGTWETVSGMPHGALRFDALLQAAGGLNTIKPFYLATDEANGVESLGSLAHTDDSLPPIDTGSLANPVAGIGFPTYANPSVDSDPDTGIFYTVPAGKSVAQPFTGRGLVTAITFRTATYAGGTAGATMLYGCSVLLDTLRLHEDVNGVPAAEPMGGGQPTTILAVDSWVRRAFFPQERYLDPGQKYWLVWTADAADLRISTGQTPDPDGGHVPGVDEPDTGLFFDEPPQAFDGDTWEPVVGTDSLAYELSIHPWQVLAKECRRMLCKLRYLKYEQTLHNGMYSPVGAYQYIFPNNGDDILLWLNDTAAKDWWRENMANAAGEVYTVCEFCEAPIEIRQYLGRTMYECSEAELASSVTNSVFPLPWVTNGYEVTYDPTNNFLPIFGAAEAHVTSYSLETELNNFFAYADVGRASFNVGAVKNRAILGRRALLAARIGVISPVVVAEGGAGHAVDDLLQYSTPLGDAAAIFRVTAVLDGAVTEVITEARGKFVTGPTVGFVPGMTIGDVTLHVDYGVVWVGVVDGGEGFTSDDVEVVDQVAAEPATFSTTMVPDAGDRYHIGLVTVTDFGSGYLTAPSLVIQGAGALASDCMTWSGCWHYVDEVLTPSGDRVGLDAKVYLKAYAQATDPASPLPPLESLDPRIVTEPIATGDSRMKAIPAPPVDITVPPTYQEYGSYSTSSRFTSALIGAANPTYEFSCVGAPFSQTASAWMVTDWSAVVDRAGHWRYL